MTLSLAVSIVLGLVIIGTLYFNYRKKSKHIDVHGPLILLHTKKGIKFIERITNFCPRFWKLYFGTGIALGFLAMFLVTIALITNAIHIIKTPAAVAGLVLLLPGITVPFAAPMIAIIILAIIHEFSHGIASRLDRIKIESVGALLIGWLPLGAFVQPNEKKVGKLKAYKKLRIFAAGSTTNIIASILLMVILVFIIIPGFTQDINGTRLVGIEKGSPADLAGLQPGQMITQAYGEQANNHIELLGIIKKHELQPGDKVELTIDGKDMSLATEEVDGQARIGVTFCSQIPPKILTETLIIAGPGAFLGGIIHKDCYPLKYSGPGTIFWFIVEVFRWSIILNFAVGFINMLPLKPFDGGLMMEAVVHKFTKKEKMRNLIVRGITLISLIILLINLIGPALRNLIGL